MLNAKLRVTYAIRNNFIKSTAISVAIFGALASHQVNAAISLDRTRIIFDGSEKSVTLNVTNQNKQLPYLAQGWIEDEKGNKIQSPLTVLPPVQRIEPGKPSQLKIQALPAVNILPQDRESVYYFNLREIPPKSTKSNTLQIALQTRIKIFYRPEQISIGNDTLPLEEQLTLDRQGDRYLLNNPTPYYVTIVDVASKKGTDGVKGFEPLMVPPKSRMPMSVSAAMLGATPVLTYVNDYGGRPQISFTCISTSCKAVTEKKR